MFNLVIFSTLPLLSMAILDLNCTAGGSYTPQAVACNNNAQDDELCKVLFSGETPADGVKAGTNTERQLKCFQLNEAPSENAKKAAISTCAKYCGFCCQTPAYNCENSRTPSLDCSRVTQDQCTDPKWRVQIAQSCPNVCGLCLEGGCVDAVPYCSSQPTICSTNGLEPFVAENCRRTCGLCSTIPAVVATTPRVAVATTPRPITCGNNVNCANWIRNNFCTNAFYDRKQIIEYCGRPCGFC